MFTSAIAVVLALAASSMAAPTPYSDPTVCAPDTGYYQKCANGYSGCSKVDMCAGWAPATSDPTYCAPDTGYYQVCQATGFKGCSKTDMCTPHSKRDATVCAPGTGYYQKCQNGFDGCSTQDECSKPSTWTPEPVPAPVPETHAHTGPWPVKPVNGVCPAGTGFYQKCSNGFDGCSTRDECSNWKRDNTVCAPGTGYYQKCSNGFEGCSTRDECSNWKRDNTVCAPGTGYYQKCSNGFNGCSTQDECSKPVWTPSPPPTWTPEPAHTGSWPVKPVNGVCPAGTGFYQKCSNGFDGCSTRDECSNWKRDNTVCAPGTGYYQKCSNGFEGCSTADECAKKAWTPSPAPQPEAPEVHAWPVKPVNGACPAGTGYYQKCANGFDGCSTRSEC